MCDDSKTIRGDDGSPRVFVHGTLRPGGAYWNEFCQDRVRVVASAWIYEMEMERIRAEGGVSLPGGDWRGK